MRKSLQASKSSIWFGLGFNTSVEGLVGGFAFVEAHSWLPGAGQPWPSLPFELKEDDKGQGAGLRSCSLSLSHGQDRPKESAWPLFLQGVSSLGALSPERPGQRLFQKGNEGGSLHR